MQPGSLRGVPSLDDDLHRLRPDGYQSTELDSDDRQPAGPARAQDFAATGPSADADDALASRAMSAMSTASAAPQEAMQPRYKRRVQIQVGSDEEDADGVRDEEAITPLQRLPGQQLSFTNRMASQSANFRSSVPLSPGSGGAGVQPSWMSFSRANAGPMLLMPPEDMPALHQAAWLNDLDTLLEILKTSTDPLENLIWVNRKLYPSFRTAASSSSPSGSLLGRDVAASGGRAGFAGSSAAAAAGRLTPLPLGACMTSSTSSLKALLQREYLLHACHPLTIAAANGNERIVDELLKAMMEDAQTRQVEHVMTWRGPPEELPPGCPWVTPLAAAALAGSGECVRLIAQTVARRKSLIEDRSTYGVYRFRPVTVAQTADAVQSLFKYGCCHADTIRYSLCDAARRLAKRDYSCAEQAMKRKHQQQQQQQQLQQQQLKQPDDQKLRAGGGGAGGAAAAVKRSAGDDDANSHGSAPDSPREGSCTTEASRAAIGPETRSSVHPFQLQSDSEPANTGGGGAAAAASVSPLLQSVISLQTQQSTDMPADAGGVVSGTSMKAAELLLFRARLFHDSLGRPLARALCEFLPETLSALAALAAMVEQGLQPDRFLSHAEHATITSTSLLMVVVRNYRTALRAAAGAPVAAAGGGAAAATSMRSGASMTASLLTANPGASTLTAGGATSSAAAAAAALPAGSDLSAAVREGLHALAAGLLAHGAVVDNPPRDGCKQVGGYHIAPPHGPEAPLDHAFIHGPQELVVLLLQYSSLHPETMEKLVGPAAAAALAWPLAAAVGGKAGGGGDLEAQAAAARAFYAKRPDGQPLSQAQAQQQQAQPSHRTRHPHGKQQPPGMSSRRGGCGQGSVPWEGGRSSPLLAFGAKMQRALLEGNVPMWLHSGRFSELMEDLIKATIATDARMVTRDLTWLVVELFERSMAHEFDNIRQFRGLDRESNSGENEAGDGSGDGGGGSGSLGGSGRRSKDGPALPGGAGSPGVPVRQQQFKDTVITVDPVVPASPAPASPNLVGKLEGKEAAVAAAALKIADLDPGGADQVAQTDAWGMRRSPGRHPHSSGSPPRRKAAPAAGGGADSDYISDSSSDGGSSSSSRTTSSSASSLLHPDAGDLASPWGRGTASLGYSLFSSPEDSMTLSIVHSLYRNTADAITVLHQSMADRSLETALASVAVAVSGAAAAALGVTGAAAAAALVDWTALLRLVARIAATTLNPPKSHGAAAAQISVFTTAKAVNQLLYARDWARDAEGGAGAGGHAGGDADADDGGYGYGGGGGGGSRRTASVVDIDLLRAIARRHPHEAARLIHGMDLMRVELTGYRWDSIPMSLDQDFYAVMTAGEPVRLSSRPPTVAPASVAAAAAAEEEQRRAVAVTAAAAARAAKARTKAARSKAKVKGSAVAPLPELGAGEEAPAAIAAAAAEATAAAEAAAAAAAAAAADAAAAAEEEPLTREDILQACIFTNMWSVLTHFLLSSTRLPAYMRQLQRLRNSTYEYAVFGLMTQYGSIPTVLVVGLLLAMLGVLARGIQRTIGLAGRLVLAGYGRLEERLQPAMNQVGRRLQLDKVQRKVGRMVRRVDQLAHRATGGSVAIGGSTALLTVRIIPYYLSFLGVLLDTDAMAEVWLGVTQHYSRSRAAKLAAVGGAAAAGGDGDGGAAGGGGAGGGGSMEAGSTYMSWRTTRVVCSRVPLACAAAMPSSLLYKLAASPQVNGELFNSPVMRAVIVWRWQHFTRYFLLLQFLEHLIYTALFMVYAFSLSYSPQMFVGILGEARTSVLVKEGCTLPPSGLQKFLLITLGVMTLTCVVQEVRQLLFFKLGWLRQPWNLMDFASSTIMGTLITLHLSCNTDTEWLRGLAAIEVALLFMRLLYFAMADDRLGSFFRMVIEVLRDCWLFFVFLGILFIGWGLALTVMQGQSGTIQNTYLQLFTMIFGDFQLSLLQSADAGSTGLDHLWRIFASLYQILVTIILLNLLIAIINDSYERINDNEACESLRNKLTLIVEAESVLPSGMARRMLERLAQTDLYVITAEAATVASNYDDASAGAEAGSEANGTTRRPLAPPARWSGRMGETKRFVGTIVDQLQAQQGRILSMLSALLAGQTTVADGLPASAVVGLAGAGREVPGVGAGRRAPVSAKRLSARSAGLGGAGMVGLRGGGTASGQAGAGAMIDMADAEAFADVLAMGRLLRDKLTDLKQEHEAARRRQDDAAAALADLHGAVERIGQQVIQSAANSAAAGALAAGALAAGAGRLGLEGSGSVTTAGTAGAPDYKRGGGSAPHDGGGATAGVRGGNGGGSGSGGSGGGGGSGGELVVIERSELESIARRAAEQAAQLAVQGVLRDLRKVRGEGSE